MRIRFVIVALMAATSSSVMVTEAANEIQVQQLTQVDKPRYEFKEERDKYGSTKKQRDNARLNDANRE